MAARPQASSANLTTGATFHKASGIISQPVFRAFLSIFSLDLWPAKPMSLTRADIQHIAQLARLQLSEAEVPVYTESLTRIFELVGELERAQTSGIEPMAHPLPGLSQRLRADEISETDRHELFQRNAPQVQAGLYLVPKVIE